MSTFSRTATLFSTVVLGSMLATTTVSSVNTVVNASETETTQAATTKKNYALKILQGDKDATSTASQFYLDTISLEKQANGNYYAYLTSNTPVNLGDKPISSEDTQHQVVEMGTTEKNGHNQTVYRLTLTADELASGQPIKTKVHVKLDAMDYDHKYDIRLAIQGFKPETAASSNANTSSSSSSVSSESSSVNSSEVSSSSVSSSSSIADSSTTTSVAPSSSSQTSSSSSQSSNNDTTASSVVADDKANSTDTKSSTVNAEDKSDSSTRSTVNTTAKQSNLKTGDYKIAVSPDSQMDKFFAKEFNVKVGESTSVVSVTYQVPNMMKMIPSVTFDGQTNSVVNNATTIDFTIPTKDLTPDKDGKVTLASFTSVPMSPSKGYNSNITFDMTPALAGTTSDSNNSSSSSSESTATSDKDILQDGTYSINYNVYKSGTTTDSTMKTYMKSPANVTVKNDQATIKFATQNDAMSMMKEFSINGATAKADGDDWVITVPVSALSKTMKSDMTIYVSAIDFTEKPSADIVFDMSSAKKTGGNGSGSSSSQTSSSSSSHSSSASSSSKASSSSSDASSSSKPSSSSSHSSSASSSSKESSISASSSSQADPKTDITKDGKYSVNYAIYKSGTKTDSTMKTYMKSPAKIAVKDGKATITFATKNDAMSMMKAFSVNGTAAKADGDNWIVTVPVSDLSKTMKSKMTIYVPQMDFTEKPSADIVFDMSSVKKTGDNGSGNASNSSSTSSQASSSSASHSSSASSTSQTSSSSASSSSQADQKTDITKDGKYSVNYNIYKSGTKTDSTMKTYMKSPAKIAVKNGKATITFATQNDAMSMMKAFSINGTKAKANGNNWIVTVPVSDLSKTMKSNMTIYVPQMDFTEKPSADIVFDMSSVKKTGDNGSGAADSSSDKKDPDKTPTPNQGNNGNSNKKPSSVKKININENGHYVLGYHVYKTGTKTPSTMQQYMTSTAVVDVKNGQATINFKTQKDAMSLMKSFAVNGHKAHAKEHGWQVTLPVSNLLHTLKSNMTIYVPGLNFTEKPSADIVFDVKNAKSTNQGNGIGTDRQISQSTGDQSATANNLGSQSRLGIPNATLHQLTILQGNSNSTSVAAQYFLPTIQLVKNSNGSYTGYVTTHTPTMMGSAPISFMDGTHQVKRVSNIKTGNYYQATYKFSLSANEVKAPINTKIHVHFTAPLNYNHTYTIRLVIGRALNNASEATQPTTGLPSMSGDTMTMPLNNSVSRGTFDPAATGTFENNDANAEQQADEMTDKKTNKEANSDKKATVKSGTNVAKNAKADQKDNSTQRNVLIIAGGIIAAALGYVGVSLLTNFFKKG
ncbi:hemagglutinin protein [Weissella jogaejeotgali]|uniref:Hemagglutinin protein n=1 Tax=Weissella jogaejeotgali TaxID=1631871 RepID=A0A1L6RE73_9LACO|nr:NEAT domain-containing protein [Weissella jogaejeotgali]APS42864.1 hemagglutinin protein [Weissella jogaejeotgali]